MLSVLSMRLYLHLHSTVHQPQPNYHIYLLTAYGYEPAHPPDRL
jgi:hypothetical protein